MAVERMDLGSDCLKGTWFGSRKDFTYYVPDGAQFMVIHVGIDYKNLSPTNLTIGSKSGDVKFKWDKQAGKARVHAWVNGAIGRPNEVVWNVFALIEPKQLVSKL